MADELGIACLKIMNRLFEAKRAGIAAHVEEGIKIKVLMMGAVGGQKRDRVLNDLVNPCFGFLKFLAYFLDSFFGVHLRNSFPLPAKPG